MSVALRWKLALGFFLVFLAGATVGSLAGNWHRRPFPLGPPQSGALAQRMTERLRTQLALTPDQTAKIAPIIEQNTARLETIRVETAHRVRQILMETHLQISPELTPEQRTKLAAMEERRRRRQARHRGFFKPPPPRPSEQSATP
jgi:Spy/CpxP family protein refolding chaperone